MRQLSFIDRLAPLTRGNVSKVTGTRRSRANWIRIIRHKARIILFSFISLIKVTGGAWWLVQPNNRKDVQEFIRESFISTSATLGMTVDNITFSGNQKSQTVALVSALRIEVGDPIFSFNPERARHRLLSLQWIENVKIERRLPSSIHVKITERRPFALWQKDNHITLVDLNGHVINVRNIKSFTYLPLIVGVGAPNNASALFAAIQSEPTLYDSLESAVWVGARRWDLHFFDGLKVLLPENDVKNATKRLARLLNFTNYKQQKFISIALRLPNRTAIRTWVDEVLDENST